MRSFRAVGRAEGPGRNGARFHQRERIIQRGRVRPGGAFPRDVFEAAACARVWSTPRGNRVWRRCHWDELDKRDDGPSRTRLRLSRGFRPACSTNILWRLHPDPSGGAARTEAVSTSGVLTAAPLFRSYWHDRTERRERRGPAGLRTTFKKVGGRLVISGEKCL
jgi:hypothetical protein